MADTIEHVRVRYRGTDPIEFHNPHQEVYGQVVNTGDVVEVPAHEVAAWPDGKNDLWEVVRADAAAARKAQKLPTAEPVPTASVPTTPPPSATQSTASAAQADPSNEGAP